VVVDELTCWVALSLVNQPFDLRGLLRRHGSVASLFDNVDARKEIGPPLRDDPAGALRCAVEIRARCRDAGVTAWSYASGDYPRALRELAWPPPVLYAVGDRAVLERPAVAIVGSRRCTGYGRWAARSLARGLSGAGVCVISGMAFGVDAAAHEGALCGRGGTAAVLGGGPERATPTSLSGLYDRLAREQLVVSEFPPGTTPRARNYPRRNRVVAALSSAILVVEAARRSGALITAREGLAAGRDVLAVPGPIDSATSAGTNQLIREGAVPVTGCADVLEVLGPLAPAPQKGQDVPPEVAPAGLEARLVDALSAGILGVDELRNCTGLSLPEIRGGLVRLRLQGAVRACGGDRFCRVE
jgi:DNA processing protein